MTTTLVEIVYLHIIPSKDPDFDGMDFLSDYLLK